MPDTPLGEPLDENRVRELLEAATPGPWSLNHPDYSVVVLGGHGYPVARASTELNQGGRDQAHADARLIALAPALAAAYLAATAPSPERPEAEAVIKAARGMRSELKAWTVGAATSSIQQIAAFADDALAAYDRALSPERGEA